MNDFLNLVNFIDFDIYSLFFLYFLGFENHDSGVGIYAPDAEAYTVFSKIFDLIIEDYHKGFKSTDVHPAKCWGDVNTLSDLDPEVILCTYNKKF